MGPSWVFRGPLASLDPRQSVESLLVEPLTVHGLSPADVEEFGRNSAKSHLAKAASMLEVVNVPIPDPGVEDHRERVLLRGDLPSPANPPKG